MKKLLLYFSFFVLFTTLNFGLEVPTNTRCEAMRDNAYFPDPVVHDTCIMDDFLHEYMACREYYNYNMMNGLDSNGKKELDDGTTLKGEGGYKAIDNYNFFDKAIKKVLLKEVKKQIAKGQGIMCIKNTEDDLFKYQESIAEHEWCYAPKFLDAFNDEFMNEHEMKNEHFSKLYNTRSDMLESKEKPKNKGVMCGVYLECMSSFISADHTRVSSGLSALYEKTKKECRSNYFTITTTTEYKHTSKKPRPKGAAIQGPKVLIKSYNASNKSKQIMYVDPKNGVVSLVGIEADATSKYESEGYKLDKKSCTFVHKRGKTKIDKSLQISLARIVKHNIFKTNNNDAFIELKVSNNNFTKRFRVPWRTLKGSGSWSGSGSKSTFDEPSAEDKAMENKIKNSEVYNKIVGTGRKMVNSGLLGDWNAKGKKGAAALGMNKQQLCTFQSVELLFGEFSKVDLSFNAKINVRISPSSTSDIEEFNLYSNAGKGHKVRGREIVLPRYEKEATSLFGNLQNSMYDKMSQKDKDAWNKSDKESKEEAQNKKDAEEFDSLSIDDLKMFSE